MPVLLLLVWVSFRGLAFGQDLLFVLPSFVQPVEPKELQGDWTGVGPGGDCTVSIGEDILRYEQPSKDGEAGEFWFETSFVIPEEAEMQQLHATIVDSAPDRSHLGKVIIVLFKMVEGTLTLGVVDSMESPPEKAVELGWDDVMDKYVLKRKESQTN